MTKPVLFYYVHHQGKGHRTLFRQLLPALTRHFEVHALVADPSLTTDTHTHILPAKMPKGYSFTHTFSKAFEGIPFTKEPAERVVFLAELIKKHRPVALFSDGSAELAIYARGMGIPVVLNRLLGDIEQDPTQRFAYDCADAIVAFFPAAMEMDNYRYKEKTTYYDFISRFTSTDETKNDPGVVSILLGSSGPSPETIKNIASVSGYTFEVIGNDEQLDLESPIIQKGRVANLAAALTGEVVISAAGLNSISELCALQKKMILIPDERPYNEQFVNARQLAAINGCIAADQTMDTSDWQHYIDAATHLAPRPHDSSQTASHFTESLRKRYAL